MARFCDGSLRHHRHINAVHGAKGFIERAGWGAPRAVFGPRSGQLKDLQIKMRPTCILPWVSRYRKDVLLRRPVWPLTLLRLGYLRRLGGGWSK